MLDVECFPKPSKPATADLSRHSPATADPSSLLPVRQPRPAQCRVRRPRSYPAKRPGVRQPSGALGRSAAPARIQRDICTTHKTNKLHQKTESVTPSTIPVPRSQPGRPGFGPRATGLGVECWMLNVSPSPQSQRQRTCLAIAQRRRTCLAIPSPMIVRPSCYH